METWTPHKTPQPSEGCWLIRRIECGKHSALSMKLSRSFLMLCRMTVFLTVGGTTIPLRLTNSRQAPTFRILTIISFFHSLGKNSDSQLLRIRENNNHAESVRAAQKSSTGGASNDKKIKQRNFHDNECVCKYHFTPFNQNRNTIQ